jgi:hypothetical protein
MGSGLSIGICKPFKNHDKKIPIILKSPKNIEQPPGIRQKNYRVEQLY